MIECWRQLYVAQLVALDCIISLNIRLAQGSGSNKHLETKQAVAQSNYTKG